MKKRQNKKIKTTLKNTILCLSTLCLFVSISYSKSFSKPIISTNTTSYDTNVSLSGDMLKISVPAKQKEQLFYTIQVQTDDGIGTYVLQYNHHQIHSKTISIQEPTQEKTIENKDKIIGKNEIEKQSYTNTNIPLPIHSNIINQTKSPNNNEQNDTQNTIINENCDNQEYQQAYDFGYKYNITTMASCTKAKMDDILIRKHAAKMIANYAINVLKKTPNMDKKCDFDDMKYENAEMQGFAIMACKLGLMGLESDGVTSAQYFNPNQSLDKAQRATILSRLIYEDTYNQKMCRYCGHVEALQQNQIITKTNDLFQPMKRGRALLMLQRT